MLQMKIYGDLVLRDVCEPVSEITPDILTTLDDMVETMKNQTGVGLAAPQVGIAKRFLVMMNPDTKEIFKMINPKIISASDKTCVMEEGCLSVLGPDDLPVYSNVSRPDSVEVEWTDETGKLIRAKMFGNMARIVQHETDHLDGVLFIDHLSPIKREMVMLGIIIILLFILLMRKNTVDLSSLREDNAHLRERISERLGMLAQNAIELKNISGDIANFKDVLMGSKQARGMFGERQLEDLVTDIMPPETYAFQFVMENGVRPDCIIRLPYPPGDMIIDSKFPLEGYTKYQENPDEGTQKIFDLSVRKHIDAISEKYIIPGKTADSAMMFIASESIFETLHCEFPDTVDYAARKKVFIVSPATLWAVLNTIRSVLSDIKIKRVAGQIKKELDMLLTDLSRLSERANKVEQHFTLAEKDIEDLQTSVRKITPRAEKLREMDFGEE